MTGNGWRDGFVAVSAVLGEPLELTLAAVGEAEVSPALLAGLRSPSKESRARALARTLTTVVVQVEALRLA